MTRTAGGESRLGEPRIAVAALCAASKTTGLQTPYTFDFKELMVDPLGYCLTVQI